MKIIGKERFSDETRIAINAGFDKQALAHNLEPIKSIVFEVFDNENFIGGSLLRSRLWAKAYE